MYFWKNIAFLFIHKKRARLKIKPALFILESDLVYGLQFTVYSFSPPIIDNR